MLDIINEVKYIFNCNTSHGDDDDYGRNRYTKIYLYNVARTSPRAPLSRKIYISIQPHSYIYKYIIYYLQSGARIASHYKCKYYTHWIHTVVHTNPSYTNSNFNYPSCAFIICWQCVVIVHTVVVVKHILSRSRIHSSSQWIHTYINARRQIQFYFFYKNYWVSNICLRQQQNVYIRMAHIVKEKR